MKNTILLGLAGSIFVGGMILFTNIALSEDNIEREQYLQKRIALSKELKQELNNIVKVK